MVRKDELEFDFLVPFLREEERPSPKDADFPATSPGTGMSPMSWGSLGLMLMLSRGVEGLRSLVRGWWVRGRCWIRGL